MSVKPGASLVVVVVVAPVVVVLSFLLGTTEAIGGGSNRLASYGLECETLPSTIHIAKGKTGTVMCIHTVIESRSKQWGW